MRRLKSLSVIILGILFVLLLSGCGKLGEKEAEQFLKNRYKDRLISSNYTVDEKNNFAQAVVITKNGAGKEVKNTEYFYVSKNKDKVIVKHINIYGVPKKLAAELASKFPRQFKEYIDLYNKLDSLYSECESACSEYEEDYFDKLDGWIENWFINEAVMATTAINNKIDVYKTAYDMAPKELQKYLSNPPDYYSLTLDSQHYYKDRTSIKP